jgi:hypothetical protein
MVLAYASGKKTSIDGLVIVNSSTEMHAANYDNAAVLKLQEALSLLKQVDPRTFNRIISDIKRIIVLSAGGPEFVPNLNSLIFSHDYVVARDLHRLMMDLVHEACHARLWRRGVVLDTDNAARIERICVREEVRLAAKLPKSDQLAAVALKRLEAKWWEPGAVRKRRERDLTRVGASRFTVRFWRWVARQ